MPPGEVLRTRPFTPDEYHRLVDAGVLREDEHVELLEGNIVPMSPQSEAHMRVIVRLNRILTRSLGDDYHIRPQGPLTLGDSEPEPDIAVVRAEDAVSTEVHPARALLVVECSGDSLGYDGTVKARIYARAAIPEYWIVDVEGRCVEIRRDPETATALYASLTTVGVEGTLAPISLPALTMAVASPFE